MSEMPIVVSNATSILTALDSLVVSSVRLQQSTTIIEPNCTSLSSEMIWYSLNSNGGDSIHYCKDVFTTTSIWNSLDISEKTFGPQVKDAWDYVFDSWDRAPQSW